MATNNAANMSTTGLQALDSSGGFTGRTITGTSNQISVANGDGTSANPTLSFPSLVTFTATQPMVLAYLSATTAAVTGDNTLYTVIFDTEINDQGANYDNTTGIFTAPISGNYLVTGNVVFGDLGTTVNFTSFLTATPAELYGVSNNLLNTGSGGFVWCPISGIIRLSAAQTIRIKARGTGGTLTNTIQGGSIVSWLSIVLMN